MNKHIETIKSLVLASLEQQDVSVALFGSMASGLVRDYLLVDCVPPFPLGKKWTKENIPKSPPDR